MWLLLVFSTAVAYMTLKVIYRIFSKPDEVNTGKPDQWFGKAASEETKVDVSVRRFKIKISDATLHDLKERLEKTRFEAPLEDSKFNYGFNSNYLREVVKYWKNDYDWRKQEEVLNKFPNYMTCIQGIDVHFIRVQPNLPPGRDIKVLPILMVHGWPGSFFEFFKIIPILTTPSADRNFVFDVICPSIPGYGFSDSPQRKGFDAQAAAHIFLTLMQERLGYNKFYVQGGDWGSFITSIMARYYPHRILGVHLNMFASRPKGWDIVKMFVLSYFPSLIPRKEWDSFFPIKEKTAFWAQESGYFHLQMTKPDTVGAAIADSPAGLAAYILEKFSTWTERSQRDLEDGGLTKKYTLDELLTNVMIYWVNNNFTSSARFYKENAAAFENQTHEKIPISVPCGIALFPQELMGMPRALVSSHVKDLVTYSVMPSGGHFAAFEEPQLLAQDIFQFVEAILKRNRQLRTGPVEENFEQ